MIVKHYLHDHVLPCRFIVKVVCIVTKLYDFMLATHYRCYDSWQSGKKYLLELLKLPNTLSKQYNNNNIH